MGVLSCPYRGAAIPGLAVRDTPATVCNHPAVRGPCVLTASDGQMQSCLRCPKYWRDSPDRVAAVLDGLPVLDPALWAKPEKPKEPTKHPSAPQILDCQHRGEDTGKRVACPTGCKAQFKVFECGVHGECTLVSPGKGIAACCGGVDGVPCPDRKPLPKPTAPQWLTIPPAPRLDLRPVLKRAVVTIASGDEGKALHAISGPLMAAYAERVGADFVVLDWPGHPLWPMSAKYAIPRTLDDHLYERIAYIDADVIVPPAAVDLFKLCEPDEFGAFDELPFARAQPRYKQEANYQHFRKLMGFAQVEHVPFYFNAGVLVVSRQHQALLEAPARPMPTGHCREQDHTNAVVLDAFQAGELKLRLLDRRANWQNWNDPDFRSAPPDALLHFSGGGEARKRRIQDMAALAARFQGNTP